MKAVRQICLGVLLICAQHLAAQNTNVNVNVNGNDQQQPAQQNQPEQTQTGDDDFHRAYVGFRYMPVFSSFGVQSYNNGVVTGRFALGHGFGGVLGVNFTRYVGLQGEVIYNVLNQKYRDQSMDRTITLNYLNIPLLLSLNTGKDAPVNLNVVAGPQLGINVGSKISSASGKDGVDTVQAVLAVKTGDLGVAYGAGLEFALGASRAVHLDLGFRGVFGLIDVSDRSKSVTTNEYYVLDRAHVKTYAGYVGLTFGF